jgi:dipeptidyl aminopeptidase/acylaminoacyl peptidase
VACVVARAAIADMTVHARTSGAAVSFMGQLPPSVAPGAPVDATAAQAYRDASPVAHVSRASAPLLLIHGDADTTVPFEQAEVMVAAAATASRPTGVSAGIPDRFEVGAERRHDPRALEGREPRSTTREGL